MQAYRNGSVIPAFNAAYLPMVRPISDAVTETGIFAIIEVSKPDIEKFGAISISAVASEYAVSANRNLLFLHLDHVPVIDEEGRTVDWKNLIKQGIDAGYDSVMIDGSRLPFEENVRCTSEIVAMAHARNAAVEAELGSVFGHESGPLPPYDEIFAKKIGFTEPDQARRFVQMTGVDWLSVSCGSIHGAISGIAKKQKKVEARIDIDHLRNLKKATGIPLVLHGGSGIKPEDVREAFRNGIAKINIGTEIRQAYENALAESGGNIGAAQKAVAETVRILIRDVYRISATS